MLHNIRSSDSLDSPKFKIGDLVNYKGSLYAIIGFKQNNKLAGYALLNKKDLTFETVGKSIKEIISSLNINPSDNKPVIKSKDTTNPSQ
jgi:hypothetical protein